MVSIHRDFKLNSIMICRVNLTWSVVEAIPAVDTAAKEL